MSKPRRPRSQKLRNLPAAAAPALVKAAPILDDAATAGSADGEPPTPVTAPTAHRDAFALEQPAESASSEPAIAACDAPAKKLSSATLPAPFAAAVEADPASAAKDVTAGTLPVPSIGLAQIGVESFGTTVMNYVIAEGEAFAAHMRALASARSVAEFVRLQIGEIQRRADATLTCWGVLAVSASRTTAAR